MHVVKKDRPSDKMRTMTFAYFCIQSPKFDFWKSLQSDLIRVSESETTCHFQQFFKVWLMVPISSLISSFRKRYIYTTAAAAAKANGTSPIRQGHSTFPMSDWESGADIEWSSLFWDEMLLSQFFFIQIPDNRYAKQNAHFSANIDRCMTFAVLVSR